jgi:predicted nucleotidyltransferase
MNRKDALRVLTERSAEIRRRFSVKDLAIFGSTARDEARPESDLDMLVTFEGPSEFDRFMDLKFYLEDMLGVQVDLVTKRALRPELRPQIEQEAIHVP